MAIWRSSPTPFDAACGFSSAASNRRLSYKRLDLHDFPLKISVKPLKRSQDQTSTAASAIWDQRSSTSIVSRISDMPARANPNFSAPHPEQPHRGKPLSRREKAKVKIEGRDFSLPLQLKTGGDNHTAGTCLEGNFDSRNILILWLMKSESETNMRFRSVTSWCPYGDPSLSIGTKYR
jgi:hypothetical protein